MTWRGVRPLVQVCDQLYPTGVRVTRTAYRTKRNSAPRSTCHFLAAAEMGDWLVDYSRPAALEPIRQPELE
jgi:hypothetical protein